MMADGVKVTYVMNLKPEVAQPFCDSMPQMLPDTRAFKGCRSVNCYRNNDDPNKIILIEEWDSKADYEKYLAWRASQNPDRNVADMMTSASAPEYWTLVD
jgi:quinol monooxygenase YgiN